MIPYFELTSFALGPLTIHVWGLMVALGILAALAVSARLARARGLDEKIIWDVAPLVILGAFLGARAFHVLLYEPSFYFAHPFEILVIWNGGLSISGGLIGAVAMWVLALARRRVNILSYAEVIVFGLPLGTFIGRIGCFLTHLHPGKPTSFILGVVYPDGVVRHDLGLYLSLDGLALFALFLLLVKRRPPDGTFIVLYLLWYGAARFMLDFFRATQGTIVDTRYFGLTPAQYFSVLLFFAGVYAFVKLRSHASSAH